MEKILEYFFNEPEREFYVRELAKTLKKSPTTISKYLTEYAKEGILRSEKKYGRLFFSASTESKSYRQAKLNYNLKRLNGLDIVEYLENEFNHPSAIILFGSFAVAENIAKSDIDICIISPIHKNVNLRDFEKKIGHEIQVFSFSKEEFNNLKNINESLYNKILNGIVLYGFLEAT